MKRYHKIAAELVVSPRDVLEARPRSSAPPQMDDHDDDHEKRDEDEQWDNRPCTD